MGRTVIEPGRKIRVLVVDDSVVIRRLVTLALQEDPELEVVGSAANGAIALQRIPQMNPDVVTLDVEMPEMDGLETLRRIRKEYPQLIVIMFSTLTSRGATATMDALSLGANDYVTKAANVGALDRSIATLRLELIPKVKQFFHAPPVVERASASPVPQPAAKAPPPRPPLDAHKGPRKAVVIGVSTGGPTALAEIVPLFPENFAVPIAIVQHMPPMFTRLLAERLQLKSKIRVVEAEQGMAMEPGKAIVAAGDYHLALKKEGTKIKCQLNQDPPENSCRPAVDVLFRSALEVYGGGVVATVLTGMGQDGLRGVEVLRPAGAYIIAQDEASSVVWGMPGAVVRAGLSDSVVSLRGVVPEILKRIGAA
ncbi:MAG: chemotaxis response regulator protein-glutamate methylesterase [Bryobacterales bacterium]|nr:chemotaxis response regulator protein-glutamate methylesterase [Bryobacterales bacterium]